MRERVTRRLVDKSSADGGVLDWSDGMHFKGLRFVKKKVATGSKEDIPSTPMLMEHEEEIGFT